MLKINNLDAERRGINLSARIKRCKKGIRCIFTIN